jgi:hypothetical protein
LGVKYDSRSTEGQRGVNILVMVDETPFHAGEPGSPENPWITYHASDVSLWDTFHAIAQLAEFQLHAQPYAVIFAKPSPDRGGLITREYNPPPSMFREAWKTWKMTTDLELFQHWNDAISDQPRAVYIQKENRLIVRSAEEQQEILKKKIEDGWRDYYASDEWKNRNQHPKSKKAPSAMQEPSPPFIPIPAWPNALNRYTPPADQPEPMVTREISLPADYFSPTARAYDPEAAGDAAKAKADIQSYLSAKGIRFGGAAAVILNDAATRVTVHNVKEQCQAIETVFLKTPSWSADATVWDGGSVPGPKVPKVPAYWSSIPEKWSTDVEKKLKRIVFPKVVLENVSLRDAVEELRKLGMRYDHRSRHGQGGIPVVIRKYVTGAVATTGEPVVDTAADEIKFSYSATHVSFGEALKAVAHLGHASIDYDWTTVYLQEESSTPVLVTGEYLILPEMFPPEGILRDKQPPARAAPQAEIEHLGSTPSAVYIEKRRRLILRDTEANQDEVTKWVEEAWRKFYAGAKARQAKKTLP